ncbi:hypothetical protein HPB50_005476 [Hyalomma asiaticum]|uniref:Uncharacterized protein n=1 Tax=Hyalomma asiaticum TaxID=266040 RepID=A0ACB7SVM8_HYAAI|nr:hypothetical protein HPB50_005476 [Hyalomma asiaticum]
MGRPAGAYARAQGTRRRRGPYPVLLRARRWPSHMWVPNRRTAVSDCTSGSAHHLAPLLPLGQPKKGILNIDPTTQSWQPANFHYRRVLAKARLQAPRNRNTNEETWPIQQQFGNFTPGELEQKREIEVLNTSVDGGGELLDLARFSAATKVDRVKAWVLRFMGNLCTKAKSGPLTAEEIEPSMHRE